MNETYTTILFGDALIGLQDPIKKLSIDDFAQLYSQYCDGPVIMATGEEKSAVYQNGIEVGKPKENGTFNRYNSRFWSENLGLDENTKPDLLASIEKDEIVPIIDEDRGGIIGYAIRGNEDQFIRALRFEKGIA